jgi:hypothetical protein
MSEAQWAWLAGFIDGEGCLGIYREKDPRKGATYSAPRASLQIVNTHYGVIEHIRDFVGAGSVQHVRAVQKSNHNDQWRYMLRNNGDLARVLRRVRPHLIVKAAHADLMLAFVESRLSARGKGRYASFTPCEHELVDTLQTINEHRGRRRKVAA